MGYSRKRNSRPPANGTFALNITSMTDMFTILLVFLLQTYSTSEVQIIPEQDVRMPLSSSQTNPIPAVKISLSKTALKLEDKILVHLKEGQFEAKDVDAKDKNFLPGVFHSLRDLHDSRKGKEIDDGRVLLLADEALPYDVLRKVMYTASMAGFPKLKMATVVGE